MTLRNAAMFAIVGTAMWTVRTAVDFIVDVSGVAGGFIAATVVMKSLVEFAAALSLLVFFVVFRRSQP